jgi:hypothetical protein
MPQLPEVLHDFIAADTDSSRYRGTAKALALAVAGLLGRL